MQAVIEQLVKLQALELDRARVSREARALPGEIARAQTALAAVEQQAATASAALSREETLRARLEREIDGHRQKAARFRSQLDSVKTPEQAAAIEHEMQFANAEIERMENEEFASLERSEAQEAELDAGAGAGGTARRLAGYGARQRGARRAGTGRRTGRAEPRTRRAAPRRLRRSGSPASIAWPPRAAPALPGPKISSAPPAAWACVRKPGTSFARASC